MPLLRFGAGLLRVGNALSSALSCCCSLFCHRIGFDECGNWLYDCKPQFTDSIGPCTPLCRRPPEPCECGPNRPCEECYQCIDSKCVRIEDCCVSDEDCPACYRCVDNTCQPCGPCEQCIDGKCYPCGPCQKCVDGVCVECGADEVCIDGVCVPKQYYCCYDSCPVEPTTENPDPAQPTTHCQDSPCGYAAGPEDDTCNSGTGCATCEKCVDGVCVSCESLDAECVDGECLDCSLTKGGPYSSSTLCNHNCKKYKCDVGFCGVTQCIEDADGEYDTYAECLDGCGADPCAEEADWGATLLPCPQSPAVTNPPEGDPAGTLNEFGYYIDSCERDICISYRSANSRPVRIQIIAPTLDQDCDVIAVTVKADSGWRCTECCDCPDWWPRSTSPGDCEGPPVGKISWTKPEGVQWFCVREMTVCDAALQFDIRVDEECPQLAPAGPCACDQDSECNVDKDCECCKDNQLDCSGHCRKKAEPKCCCVFQAPCDLDGVGDDGDGLCCSVPQQGGGFALRCVDPNNPACIGDPCQSCEGSFECCSNGPLVGQCKPCDEGQDPQCQCPCDEGCVNCDVTTGTCLDCAPGTCGDFGDDWICCEGGPNAGNCIEGPCPCDEECVNCAEIPPNGVCLDGNP